MFPARQAAQIPAELQRPVAQRCTTSLSPDKPLYIRGLQLAVDTENGAVTVDDELRVEQRVSLGHALADAEVDGNTGAPAYFLEGTYVRVVGFDDDGFFGVFCEGGNLGQGRVAFDEILYLKAWLEKINAYYSMVVPVF